MEKEATPCKQCNTVPEETHTNICTCKIYHGSAAQCTLTPQTGKNRHFYILTRLKGSAWSLLSHRRETCFVPGKYKGSLRHKRSVSTGSTAGQSVCRYPETEQTRSDVNSLLYSCPPGSRQTKGGGFPLSSPVLWNYSPRGAVNVYVDTPTQISNKKIHLVLLNRETYSETVSEWEAYSHRETKRFSNQMTDIYSRGIKQMTWNGSTGKQRQLPGAPWTVAGIFSHSWRLRCLIWLTSFVLEKRFFPGEPMCSDPLAFASLFFWSSYAFR